MQGNNTPPKKKKIYKNERDHIINILQFRIYEYLLIQLKVIIINTTLLLKTKSNFCRYNSII